MVAVWLELIQRDLKIVFMRTLFQWSPNTDISVQVAWRRFHQVHSLLEEAVSTSRINYYSTVVHGMRFSQAWNEQKFTMQWMSAYAFTASGCWEHLNRKVMQHASHGALCIHKYVEVSNCEIACGNSIGRRTWLESPVYGGSLGLFSNHETVSPKKESAFAGNANPPPPPPPPGGLSVAFDGVSPSPPPPGVPAPAPSMILALVFPSPPWYI